MYYRVYDYQTGRYFGTGYNSTSIKELVKDFKSYINDASEVCNQFKSWKSVKDYLQDVELEKSKVEFINKLK